jgi:hypothetical protein
MADVRVFKEGGYRYIAAVFQYSGGVAAEAGYEIERVRFARPLALEEGFAAARAHLEALGRPLAALCACELRSPEPFTEQGFYEFNTAYTDILGNWGIYRDRLNPVARTNVCPSFEPPRAPALYAFSYTVPARAAGTATFVVSGAGEAPEGKDNYRDHVIRPGDTSIDGMREKMRFVVAEMERRMSALGATWRDAHATQAYTVRDIGALVSGELVVRGAAAAGLNWHFCLPPVAGLEYEMDVRAVAREIVL